MASLGTSLSYILRTTWAILSLGIWLSGVERGVSAPSIHKKEPDMGIFFGKRLPWCLKKIRISHECLTAVLEYCEWKSRRTGLTIFRKDLAGVHLGRNDSFLLYLSSPFLLL